MVQAHIFYAGTVQGVGFRYTAQRIAGKLNIGGWVKNLADGRVEILAESEKENIEKLCSALENEFNGYIRDKIIDFHEARGNFQGFKVAF